MSALALLPVVELDESWTDGDLALLRALVRLGRRYPTEEGACRD